MTSLSKQLDDYKTAFKARVDPARVAMMEAATEQLRQSGLQQRALSVGQIAPERVLRDALGQPVSMKALWEQGPLVLIFYRGGWCPYCNLTLRAWSEQLETLRALGAGLVAISPQTPDNSLSTQQKNELAYPVLSDSGLQLAQAFGLSFELPPELVSLYAQVGNDLPLLHGDGRWALPVPATFLIDSRGRIAYAHVEADYRERAEPDQVMQALRNLTKG